MRGRKILATIIAMAMILSAIVLISNTPSAAIPGHNEWGNANMEIVVFKTYADGVITINTTGWAADTYYLYYPIYGEDGLGSASNFNWSTVPYKVGGYNVRVDATPADDDELDAGGAAIDFNCSGMWIFDTDGNHNGNNSASFDGYMWVNTSSEDNGDDYLYIDSIDDIYYNSTSNVAIIVTDQDDEQVGCMISVLDPDGKTVYHAYRADGKRTLGSTNFSKAGEYRVLAYLDADENQQQVYFYPDGETDYEAYNSSYGNGTNFPIDPDNGGFNDYNYGVVGPFDPPEYNATPVIFEVLTGKPAIILTNASPVYWGHQTKIEVNVTDYNGDGISGGTIKLKKSTGATYYTLNTTVAGKEGEDFEKVWLNETKAGHYTIEMPRADPPSDTNWSDLGNGTWYLYFEMDIDGGVDAIYEWNNSKKLTISSASPKVDLEITDDGYSTTGTKTDKKVDVPHVDPGQNGGEETIDIKFKIYGRGTTGKRVYYGDDTGENIDNITISGDILYATTGTTLNYNIGTNEWTATVTPTKPGGKITISVDWPGSDNGTDSEEINIVNGTTVTTNLNEFTVGNHINLTVTVKDMDNDPIKTSTVRIFFEGGGNINDTATITGDNTEGNGKNGEYTIWIKPSDQGGVAPKNITIAANWPGTGNFWGYTKLKMEKNHNLMVNASPTAAYAGDATEYDIQVSLVGGGEPDDDITVALYDMNGDLVTGVDEWTYPGADPADIEDEEIILSGGTYQIYSYNNTWDSRGNNATITITPYTVESTPSVLAWLIDIDINMSFQVLPAVNGTLTLNNVSATPNASDTTTSLDIDVEEGIATLDGLNASTLGNITFAFQPADSSESRPAEGLVRITTAVATPSPPTIYLLESTNVVITLTHPASSDPIPGVLVGIDEDINLSESILSKLPTSTKTDANGQVAFGITAEATGQAVIFIKGNYDSENKYVITGAIKKTLEIDAPPSVNEGEDFTVTVTDSNGDPVENAVVEFAGEFYTTDADGEIDPPIEAPDVQVTLDYDIDVTATGYTSASDTIKVINMPELFIKPPASVTEGKTFTVIAGGDDGNGNGITVTIYKNGVEVASDTTVNGEATFKVGKSWKAGTYTAQATKTGYNPSETKSFKVEEAGGTPGFELLTLIAAIGVALILLRRRRH